MSLGAIFRKQWFSISPEEATIDRRGFRRTTPQVQSRLEQIGGTFLHGYGLALESADAERLVPRLNRVEAELRGFAFEGAAMALALFDFLTPWKRNRLGIFLCGAGDAHAYMAHVGAGWAAARIPWVRWNSSTYWKRFDPLLRWLALDGFGFHQGYFHWQTHIRQRAVVKELSPYARRAFDQGLGRSLWFVEGADISQIGASLERFEEPRRADLWSGVGLACAYAGGVDDASIERLREVGRPYLPQIAQGAAFAAKARQRAGNPAEHTDLACRLLCRRPAEEAARITDECLVDLPNEDDQPRFEHWRRRVQQRLSED